MHLYLCICYLYLYLLNKANHDILVNTSRFLLHIIDCSRLSLSYKQFEGYLYFHLSLETNCKLQVFFYTVRDCLFLAFLLQKFFFHDFQNFVPIDTLYYSYSITSKRKVCSHKKRHSAGVVVAGRRKSFLKGDFSSCESSVCLYEKILCHNDCNLKLLKCIMNKLVNR